MIIRKALSTDTDAIAALSGAGATEPWDAVAVTRFLDSPGCWTLVAVEAAPVGFLIARVAAGEAEIINLVVGEAARRRGIARLLVAAALDHAARNGASNMFLEVADDNDAARALYAAIGFESVGRRSEYYRRNAGAHVDAIIMRRIITGTIHV